MQRPPIRNLAIIAHVDHGKTTLVDGLLRQSGAFRENEVVDDCFLDSGDLERERGITILAKNTVVWWKGVKINIVDTPGHADFGGEVERVLSMADGALLLVDAFEGPMPQTRFVLQKAFDNGLEPIVVINKVDRPDARSRAVANEVFDLLIDLGAGDEVLDVPVLYTSAKEGRASTSPDEPGSDLGPLFDAILAHLPAPADDRSGPLQFRVSTLDYSDFVGRIAVGRVHRGSLRRLAQVVHVASDGRREEAQVRGVYRWVGIGREECDEVGAGDICAVWGIASLGVGDSLCDPDVVEPLPPVAIDEPTISMVFRVNDSPFAGREGRYVTSRQIEERLQRELRSNVALRVESSSPDAFTVSGRGLMHLGILAETMRREGYEFAVGPPRVILRAGDDERREPIELLVIDTPEEFLGKVIEFLGRRKGELRAMTSKGSQRHLEFDIPARGLIGARTRLLNLTQGNAVLHHRFLEYGPWRGDIPGRSAGVLVSSATGPATGYSIDQLRDRGTFFVAPQTEVYAGMIVGEHCKDNDIVVNVCREKKMTNVRSSTKESFTKLVPPRILGLEEALEYAGDDELVELTPSSIRLRKAVLGAKARKRAERV